MSYAINNSGAVSGVWTSTTAMATSITAPVTLTKEGKLLVEDDVGEKTDVGQAAKMFMWWMRTYYPEAEQQFHAVEDIKRGVK